jgi:hypothetical protein
MTNFTHITTMFSPAASVVLICAMLWFSPSIRLLSPLLHPSVHTHDLKRLFQTSTQNRLFANSFGILLYWPFEYHGHAESGHKPHRCCHSHHSEAMRRVCRCDLSRLRSCTALWAEESWPHDKLSRRLVGCSGSADVGVSL